ncbi:4-coumarate--CoA ligase 5-like [Ixodes scapularis]|uniref:4-coumarate--CoA ligase 5-like n=1 Tax=Ixodes scapularis TaxID=6945 RepID=UPI001A9EA7F7|nr:4-coumarate--CoA ligase 5-like [Ixodes scapularis]
MAKTSYVANKDTAPNLLKMTMPSTIKELFCVGSVPGFIDVLEFQDYSEASLKPHMPADTTEEVVVMLYTSGTTGLPKDVQISHKAYVSSYHVLMASGHFAEDDIILAWNPFTHASGFVVDTICVCLGVTVIITEHSLSCKDFLETLSTHQISVIFSTSERLREIVNEARTNNHPAVGLKKIIVGGTMITESVGADLCEFFGANSLVIFYGLTETFPIVSGTPPGKICMDNVGVPCAGTKVKILDLFSGDSLGPYQKGEIVVQSRTLMKGYYGRPEATQEVLSSDGWFRTGDLGYYDNDGQMYFVDRIKQMIKCMGNIVTSAELEEILTSHEAVLEAAVVGIPSSKYGQAPVACVVVKETQEECLESLEQELKELVAGSTSFGRHLYGGVVFMNSLPKSETGKILRQELRSRVLSGNV